MVQFEQPANEQTRVFLRLEFLEEKARYFLKNTDPWSSRASLEAIIDILHLLDRPELRNKITQEITRIQINLQRLQATPQIDKPKCQSIIERIDEAYKNLHKQNGKFAEQLRQTEFMKILSLHHCAPGGICEFQLPEFQSWLASPIEERQADLSRWIDSFKDIFQVRTLLLSLYRDSAIMTHHIAKEGFYQTALEQSQAYQLIRIQVENPRLYPIISMGRHGLSIRFLLRVPGEKSQQTKIDVPFDIASCVF